MRTDTLARQFDPRHKNFDDTAFKHAIVRIEEVSNVTDPIPAGATLTLSNIVPAGVLLLGVVCHVIEEIFGATASLTSFNIGDGVDADLYGATISPLAGTRTLTADFTAAAAALRFTTAAEDVVYTAVGENFAGGAIATSVLFMTLRGQRKRGA